MNLINNKQTIIKKDKYIKKHNAAIRSYSEMTLLERKIANVLLYNAYHKLTTESTYVISISQLLSLLSLKTNDYQKLKQGIRQLMLTIIEWNVSKTNDLVFSEKTNKIFDSKETWQACTLLSSVQIDGTLIKYEYSGMLRKWFYQPTFYSKINLYIQSQFKSAYSLCLYENCLSYLNCRTTGWIDLQSFRKLMGVAPSQYKIFRDFNRRVLQSALREINKLSDIDVVCETKKIGRVVCAIKLCISNKKSIIPKNATCLENVSINNLVDTLISYGISKIKATLLIKQYGESYIKDKLDLINNATVKIKNPIAYLIKAIEENWVNSKIKTENPIVQNISVKKSFTKEENITWFNALTDQEKLGCLEKVIFKFPMFQLYMKNQKVDLLNKDFISHYLFGMFIEALNRD